MVSWSDPLSDRPTNCLLFRSHSQSNSSSGNPATPHSYYQSQYYPNYQPFYSSNAPAWWASAYQQPVTGSAGYYYAPGYHTQQYYDSSATVPVLSDVYLMLLLPLLHRVPKFAIPLLQACLVWISIKYHKLHYLNITYDHIYYDVRHFTVCSRCNVIMMPEFVYIKVTFNTLLLTKGSSSSVAALD